MNSDHNNIQCISINLFLFKFFGCINSYGLFIDPERKKKNRTRNTKNVTVIFYRPFFPVLFPHIEPGANVISRCFYVYRGENIKEITAVKHSSCFWGKFLFLPLPLFNNTKFIEY